MSNGLVLLWFLSDGGFTATILANVDGCASGGDIQDSARAFHPDQPGVNLPEAGTMDKLWNSEMGGPRRFSIWSLETN